MKLFANNCSFGAKRQNTILKIRNQWNFANPYILLLKYETFRKQRQFWAKNAKIQSRHIADPQNMKPVAFRPIPILLRKYGTIRKQLQFLGQNAKIQSRRIADPQNPQPVEFRTSLILLLKYETIRKQLQFGTKTSKCKVVMQLIPKFRNQWNFATSLFYC